MQDHRPFDVTHQCSVYHEGHHHPVILAFDKENPAAVELVFMPEMISWIFARDLLFQGAIQGVPAGEGNILVTPMFSQERGSHLVLALQDHDNDTDTRPDRHELVLDRRTAQKFLYATMDLVQLGEEDYSVQVDAFLHVMQLGRDA